MTIDEEEAHHRDRNRRCGHWNRRIRHVAQGECYRQTRWSDRYRLRSLWTYGEKGAVVCARHLQRMRRKAGLPCSEMPKMRNRLSAENSRRPADARGVCHLSPLWPAVLASFRASHRRQHAPAAQVTDGGEDIVAHSQQERLCGGRPCLVCEGIRSARSVAARPHHP